MGLTYSDDSEWTEIAEGHKIASTHHVSWIGIRLRYQVRSSCQIIQLTHAKHSLTQGTNQCYDLQSLLATLLHEFAHAITPPEMKRGHDDRGRYRVPPCFLSVLFCLFERDVRCPEHPKIRGIHGMCLWPSWSKACGSGPHIFGCVGSNPTGHNLFWRKLPQFFFQF